MQFFYRHSITDITRVINAINKPGATKLKVDGETVGVSSLRMRTFGKCGVFCSACNLQAKFFAVEQDRGARKAGTGYHLNLYGVDSEGNEVLFTHDHTIARSAGGADNLSNTTTMCYPCNQTKSIPERELSRLNAVARKSKKQK